jgi:hypothetical protein
VHGDTGFRFEALTRAGSARVSAFYLLPSSQ